MIEILLAGILIALVAWLVSSTRADSSSSGGKPELLEGTGNIPKEWGEFASRRGFEVGEELVGTFHGRGVRARPSITTQMPRIPSSAGEVAARAAITVALAPYKSDWKAAAVDRWVSCTFRVAGEPPVNEPVRIHPRHHEVHAMPTPADLRADPLDFLRVDDGADVVRELVSRTEETARLVLQVFVRNGEWLELRPDGVTLRCETLTASSRDLEWWLDLGCKLLDELESPEPIEPVDPPEEEEERGHW